MADALQLPPLPLSTPHLSSTAALDGDLAEAALPLGAEASPPSAVPLKRRNALLMRSVAAAAALSGGGDGEDEGDIASGFAGLGKRARPAHPPWFRDVAAMRFLVMVALSAAFCAVEIGVGVSVGSLALQADAFHVASDVVAMLVGFFALRSSRRGPSGRASFGLVRMEVVGSLVNGVFLLAICVQIFIESLQRLAAIDFRNRSYVPLVVLEASTVMAVGCVGLLINLLGLVLFSAFGGGGHGHSHGGDGGHGHTHGGGGHSAKPKAAAALGDDHHGHAHSSKAGDQHGHAHGDAAEGDHHGHAHGAGSEVDHHGHSHGAAEDDHHGHAHGSASEDVHRGHAHGAPAPASAVTTKKPAAPSENLNVRSAILHIFGDALGSLAVVVSGAIMAFTDLPLRELADPLSTLCILVVIVANTLPLVRHLINILLEKVPEHVDIAGLRDAILNVDGVLSVHDLHVWQLDSQRIIAMVHVLVDRSLYDTDGEVTETPAVPRAGPLAAVPEAPGESSEHDGAAASSPLNLIASTSAGSVSGTGSGWRRVVDEVKVAMHRHGVHASAVQPEFLSLNVQRMLTQGHSAAPGSLGRIVRAHIAQQQQLLQQQQQLLPLGVDASAPGAARASWMLHELAVCNEPVCDETGCEAGDRGCCPPSESGSGGVSAALSTAAAAAAGPAVVGVALALANAEADAAERRANDVAPSRVVAGQRPRAGSSEVRLSVRAEALAPPARAASLSAERGAQPGRAAAFAVASGAAKASSWNGR